MLRIVLFSAILKPARPRYQYLKVAILPDTHCTWILIFRRGIIISNWVTERILYEIMPCFPKYIIDFSVTNNADLSETVPILASKVLCPRNPPDLGRLKFLGTLCTLEITL